MTPRSDSGPLVIDRVDWSDPRAAALRDEMDGEMGERYADRIAESSPEELAALERSLTVDEATVVATLLARIGDEPVGHAALRRLGDDVELKRLMVRDSARGRGVATALLDESLRIAAEVDARRVILQTGDAQPEAVALYEKTGWTRIPVYEPYATTIPYSFCFERVIR